MKRELLPPISILGTRWEIKLSDAVSLEGDNYGTTHLSTMTIYLNPHNTEQHMRSTLWHEIMHACIHMVGLDQRFDDKDQHITEHELIYALVPVQLQVLRDNPELLQFLTTNSTTHE